MHVLLDVIGVSSLAGLVALAALLMRQTLRTRRREIERPWEGGATAADGPARAPGESLLQ